jgi:protoporphyrinogen oxidase
MSNETTVILGAGPAGLAAGYELAGKGIRPIILEKAGKVGGLSRTETFKDYKFDIGGHRFFTREKEIDELWRRMLGEDFLKVSRRSRIHYKGRFFNYPLDLLNAFSNLGIAESSRVLLSYIQAQIQPSPREETFDEWITNRFGSRLYEMFFKEYTEKVWGLPCSTIQAEWAAQRINGLSLTSTLLNAALGTKKARTLIDEFHYPVQGPGMMWRRFEAEFKSLGGQVWLNAEVTGLKREKDRIASVICDTGNETVEIPVEEVISSLPISELISILEPEAPVEVLKASQQLKYRDFIIVGLILDEENVFLDQWIYIHNPDVRVARIQNFKNWSVAMVPDPRQTSIGMEYFCNEGDALWKMSDAALTRMALRELAELGFAGINAVIDQIVIRQPDAYPVYDTGYRRRLDIVRDFLGTLENFQTVGRNGMHRYNNMDHSMQTGFLAARNILGGNHDLWGVNKRKEFLEMK